MELDALRLAAKKTALEAAFAGGEVAMRGFGRQMRIDTKSSDTDLVTEFDRKAQEAIVNTLKARFPDHGFLGEEDLSANTSAEFVWVIDPIDGTTNYAHHSPIFAMSIGLLHHNEPVMGVVHAPAMSETFVAVKNHGATLNDEPIGVSGTDKLNNAVLATGFYPLESVIQNNLKHFTNFVTCTRALRRLGAAALDLCWVAMGRFDGYWEFGLSPWDVAAGHIIVTEAGGRISDYAGGKYELYTDNLLCSNGLIHNQMQAVLQAQTPA